MHLASRIVVPCLLLLTAGVGLPAQAEKGLPAGEPSPCPAAWRLQGPLPLYRGSPYSRSLPESGQLLADALPWRSAPRLPWACRAASLTSPVSLPTEFVHDTNNCLLFPGDSEGDL